MGFLDRLVHKVVSNVVDAAVDSVMDSVLGNKETTVDGATGNRGNYAAENRAATKRVNCSGERLLMQRIEEITAREKPEYELRKKVSAGEVDAPAEARPFFDYGFYRDGVLVAVVMILDNNNEYRYREVRLAQQACRDRQVKYMNFMAYMTNKPEYISQRLRNELP